MADNKRPAVPVTYTPRVFKQRMFKNFFRVDDKLWSGEYPGAYDTRQGSAHLRLSNVLRVSGATAFLDLTDAKDRRYVEDYHQYLPNEIVYASYPVVDESVPTPAYMISILDQIYLWQREGRVVYMHCRGGIGRSGTVVGCYLMESGLAVSHTVIPVLRNLRQIADCWDIMCPNTISQRSYIEQWLAYRNSWLTKESDHEDQGTEGRDVERPADGSRESAAEQAGGYSGWAGEWQDHGTQASFDLDAGRDGRQSERSRSGHIHYEYGVGVGRPTKRARRRRSREADLNDPRLRFTNPRTTRVQKAEDEGLENSSDHSISIGPDELEGDGA